MPKLICPCGFIHDLSPIPDDGWRAIRDKDLESYIQHERACSEGFNSPEGSDKYEAYITGGSEMIRMSTLLYECPECGRIMWSKTRCGDFRIYAPENRSA